jgi:hypothetical protein
MDSASIYFWLSSVWLIVLLGAMTCFVRALERTRVMALDPSGEASPLPSTECGGLLIQLVWTIDSKEGHGRLSAVPEAPTRIVLAAMVMQHFKKQIAVCHMFSLCSSKPC